MTETTTTSSNEDEDDEEGQKKPLVQVGGKDIEQFNNLFLRAIFSDNFKKEASEEEKEIVFEEIRAVCLIRGIIEFISSLRQSEGAFTSVMSRYATIAVEYMQETFNGVHADKEKGGDLTSQEQRLLRFFENRGIVPQPPRQHYEKSEDAFLDGLKKYARENGISEELFDTIISEAEEEKCSSPKPLHQYSVVCPEHGRVYLSDTEYTEQLLNPDKGWFCTECGAKSLLYDEEEEEEEEEMSS